VKTLKQISDEIGISKQRLYRYVKSNHISESSFDGKAKFYDYLAERMMRKHFVALHDAGHVSLPDAGSVAADTIDRSDCEPIGGSSPEAKSTDESSNDLVFLKSELDAKNKQIEFLSRHIECITRALLVAQAHPRHLQDGQISPHNDGTESGPANNPAKRRGLLHRIKAALWGSD